jgi:UDP-N-acetylglucosamine 4,6-dehydratase
MLITGGTGAFGRAFARYAMDKGVKRICVYSRDEYKQAQMREQFNDDYRLRFFIGDVRDKERLRRAMRGVSTVIHAAALKRIEVGRYDTSEMVKTNVTGTMNVIEASQDVPSVRRVVYLSTDKAWAPVSGYGYTKALGEALMLSANEQVGPSGPAYTVTRYGNVADSTGSVIPTWRKCIAEGRDIKVTDPDCTRFWMTMQEACDLVWKAMHCATRDTPLIPCLPAYRLGDLLHAMIGEIEPQPKVIATGLPGYEKTHEGMADGNTSDVARRMSIEEIRDGLRRLDEESIPSSP